MKLLSRNKTAASSSNPTIPTGLKQMTDKSAVLSKGQHLKSIMRQEIRKHRNERASSPDTEASSYYTSDDDDSDAATNGWGIFGGCGGGDQDFDTQSDSDSMESATPAMPAEDTCRGKGSKQTDKTAEDLPFEGYPSHLVNAVCQLEEMRRNRDSDPNAAPDDSSYYSGSQESAEDSVDESVDDKYVRDDDNSEGDASSAQQSVKSAAPIGTPNICGIPDWLFASDYGPANQAKKSSKKSGEADKKAAAELLNNHPGQLDIYAKTTESLILRKYSKPPRLQSSDHILVKVEASTVSIHDYLARTSGNNDYQIPGRQVMGEVYRIGKKAGAVNLSTGDRVVALTPNGFGGNARYISIPASSAIYVPPEIQRDDAICLVESYMAAYQMLNLGRTNGIPLTDANVLIIGGSDPVGQAMVELAIREGANVYATADKAHREYLEKMGATWFPNKTKKFSKLSKKMDVVIDTLCLDGYKSSYEALNGQGKLVCTSNPPVRDNGSFFERMERSWTMFKAKYVWPDVEFYDIHQSFQEDPHMFEHEFRYLLCKLRNKEIQPKISGRIALNQVPKAQNLLEKGLPNGTIVVLPWEKLDSSQDVPVENVR